MRIILKFNFKIRIDLSVVLDLLGACVLVHLEHVLVCQLVVDAHTLRVELHGAAPHHCVRKLLDEVFVDLHQTALYSSSVSRVKQNNWVGKVRLRAKALGVNAHQAKLLPDFIEQNVDTQVHLHRDAAVLRVLHLLVDVLNRDGVDLIVDIDALDVFSVALDHVNQLVHIVVAIELDFSVVDPVLGEHLAHHLLVDLGEGPMRGEEETARLLDLNNDVWPFLVHADACSLDFSGELSLLLLALLSIEDHQD